MAALPGDGTFCQLLEGSTLSSFYVVFGAFACLYHDPTNLKGPGVDYKSLASPASTVIDKTQVSINQSQSCKRNAE